MSKTAVAFVLYFIVYLLLPKLTLAYEIPEFSSCPNPGGTQIASYDQGIHGIPGDQKEYLGSDSVYKISPYQVVQCFCHASSNSGVQTNWLKIINFSLSDIEILKNLGWIYIPDGSVWGLDQGPYVAINKTIYCYSQTTVEGDPVFSPPQGPFGAPQCTAEKPPSPRIISINKTGTQATISWTSVNQATHYMIFYGTKPHDYQYSVPNTGKVTTYTIFGLDPNTTYYYDVRAVNDCMPSDPGDNGIGGGNVLGISYYAPTGNSFRIVSLLGMGFSLLVLYFLLKKPQSREV